MATTLDTPRPQELTSAGRLSAEAKPQLEALTGIRFIAAVMVVVCHVAIMFHIGANDPNGLPAMRAWSAIGAEPFDHSWLSRGLTRGAYVAVNLFFMLSGFVLTYTCLTDQGEFKVNRRGFWASRFARIYPVYLLGLLVSFLLFLVITAHARPPFSNAERWIAAGATLLFLQGWWPRFANVWNPPAWSLSAEAFFYVLFPFALTFLQRRSRSQLWTIAAILYVVGLTPPTIYWLTSPDGIHQTSWISEGTWINVIKYNPLVRAPEFLVGMVLGCLFGYRAFQNAQAGRSSPGWLTAAALLGIVGMMAISEFLPYPIMHNGATMPLFVLLIYDLSMGGGPIGWLLSRRPMVLLGDSTYVIYVLHAAFVGYGIFVLWFALGGREIIEHDAKLQAERERTAISQTQPSPAAVEPPLAIPPGKYSVDSVASPSAFLWTTLISCILISIAIHKLYEIPTRKFIRRRLSRRHLKLPPVPPADLP